MTSIMKLGPLLVPLHEAVNRSTLLRLSSVQNRVPASKNAIVMMVRDEIDILPTFLAHHLGLVDHIFVVDHRSSDGTREYLTAVCAMPEFQDQITLVLHDDHAYLQSHITTALAWEAHRQDYDWIFPIDADEFLHFESRRELEQALIDANSSIVHLRWRNVIPRLHGDDPASPEIFSLSKPFETLAGGVEHGLGKVGVHRSLMDAATRFRIHQGGHSVELAPRSGKLVGVRAGTILHMPARTTGQVLLKIGNQLQALGADPRAVDQGPATPQLAQKRYESALRDVEQLRMDEDPRSEAQRMFETIVLGYEKPERKTTPRSEWIRHDVTLPLRLRRCEGHPVLGALSDCDGPTSDRAISQAVFASDTTSVWSGTPPERILVGISDGRVSIRSARLGALLGVLARGILMIRVFGPAVVLLRATVVPAALFLRSLVLVGQRRSDADASH